MSDGNIRTELDGQGILLATIDMPRSMNVFSSGLMDSLESLIAHAEGDSAIRGVVMTSGKATFLAGADLEMVHMFTERASTDTPQQLHALCGRLGRLFRRLECGRKPYIAAVNGLALGGGLEFAMACHERVVADLPDLQLGLPEIKLGLLPGAGGTQRLPRLVGPSVGMQMLLTGEPRSPGEALEAGLATEITAPELLVDRAKQRALALQSSPVARWDIPGASFPSAPFDFEAPDGSARICRAIGITEEQWEHYPAYRAIVDCVVGGWTLPMTEACDREMAIFVELIRDRVAGNMVRTLFLNRQRAAKLRPSQRLSTAKLAVLGQDGNRVQSELAVRSAPLIAAADLTAEDIALLLPRSQSAIGRKVAFLGSGSDKPADVGAAVGIWIGQPTPLGHAAEVLVRCDDPNAIDAGLMCARWFGVLPLVTRGNDAVLPALQSVRDAAVARSCSAEQTLLAVGLAAARAWEAGAVPETELADVAAVIAGLHPAYTGGPFTYLRQCGAADIRARVASASAEDADLMALPGSLEELLESTCASAAKPAVPQ